MFTHSDSPISIKITNIKKYPIHSHKDITEILLPIKGDINVVASHERIYVKEGDFYFVNNNSIHSIQGIDESIVAVFHIDLNYFEKKYPFIKNMFFRNNMYSKKYSKINCDNFDCKKQESKIMFRNKLIGILIDSVYKAKLSNEISSLYGEQLILSMVKEFNWLQFLNSDHIPPNQLDRYHRVVRYIHEHIHEKITLDDIASREFISKNYFSHFWKKISNFSFLDRVNFEKVIKSEHLLLSTDDSIVSIAEKFGFSDVKYYYRHFKKWYGCTPQNHRNRCNKYMDSEMVHLDISNGEAQKILEDYLSVHSLASLGNISLSTVTDNPLLDRVFSLDETNFTNKSMSVVLDLFKYIEVKNQNIEINFHSVYQIILLTNAKNLGLTIKIDCSNIEESYIFKALNIFFEFSLFHFGKNIIRKWDYFIKYNESVSIEDIKKIKRIVQRKIEKPTFRYYLEI